MTSGSTELWAGFGEVDITPGSDFALVATLGSVSASRAHSRLYARTALFDDGSRRVALVSLDLVAITPEAAADLRTAVAAAAGLSASDVLVACTHAHNGPCTIYEWPEPPNAEYLAFLAERLPEAAAEATASLEPVGLRYGSFQTKGLTFNRRPMYRDGEVGSGGPQWVDEFIGVEGPVDEELQLLLATRADGSFAGGIVGFACHPHTMGPCPVWSSDFPGALSAKLARRHGVPFLFLQGAGGDLHWADMSEPTWWSNWWVDPQALAEPVRANAEDQVERQAEALFAASELAISSSRPLAGGGVRVESAELELAQRSAGKEQVELARWFLDQDPETVDLDDFNQKMSGHRFTFFQNSAAIQTMFARDTIELDEWRADGEPPSDRVEVQAISVGDVAFVAYPAEMFTEFGLRTKVGSPFAATFVCGVTNGYFGYVPTAGAFAHGGYEARLGHWSRLPEDGGDAMTAAALGLLERQRADR